MIIRLTKAKGDKPGTLTCLRDDGTTTWQRSTSYFAYHDLIHYAVETTLGYWNAFLGLVAKGRDLDSFGTKNGVKDVYTAEEGWAENIAGAIQWLTASSSPTLSNEEILTWLVKSAEAQAISPPCITAEQIGQIREKVRMLHARWDGLPPGGVMELTF
jgi:hypothetical protein